MKINPGFYHYACGLCTGVFIELAVTNEPPLYWWAWIAFAVVATCLSGFYGPKVE